MMKSRRNSQPNLPSSRNGNGEDDIRVTAGSKKRFSLFNRKKDATEEDVIYGTDSLKGRSPVCYGEAQYKQDEELASKKKESTTSVPSKSPQSNRSMPTSSIPVKCSRPTNTKPTSPNSTSPRRATWASPQAGRSGGEGKTERSSSLAGRNPVDFSGSDANGNPNGWMGDPLAGRNPQDFDKSDPYGNPIGGKGDPLAGRNPKDFDKTDAYGNPINAKDRSCLAGHNPRNRDPLAGRNPQDFDKSDPYGNPIGEKGDPLAGRNPKDFDKTGPYGNPINVNNRNPLAGRNPRDFGPVLVEGDESEKKMGEREHQCHLCQRCKQHIHEDKDKSLKVDLPAVITIPSIDSKDTNSNELKDVFDDSAEDDEEMVDGAVEDESMQEPSEAAATEEPTKERSVVKDVVAGNTTPKQNKGAGNTSGDKIQHLDRGPDFEKEQVDLEHVETIKREIRREVPAWANAKLKPTERGRSIKRAPPPKKREKFSLRTYYQPRQAVAQ